MRKLTMTSTYVEVQREYASYTDANNFERIEWTPPLIDGSIVVSWQARGTGTRRRPEATVVGDVIEIRCVPIQAHNWEDADAQIVVNDAVGKTVKLISPYKTYSTDSGHRPAEPDNT